MLFKKLTGEELTQKIKKLGLDCDRMWGTIFYSIYPKQNNKMALKRLYKPMDDSPGLFTELHLGKKESLSFIRQAQDRLEEKEFFGMHYDNPEASFKLHISLNHIGELDETIILGLIQLLAEEASSPNNLNFHFKIIDPVNHDNNRFNMNDQLTLYFDKYSSTAEMMNLAKKIDIYLKKHIKENEQPLGKKDSFGFNSFVSARFDTNRLLSQYDVYSFFDLELKKFFEQHSSYDLETLPLCAFEAVFYTVIGSNDITLPYNKKGAENRLSDADSVKVQSEFKKMLENPLNYLGASIPPEKMEDLKKQRVISYSKTISKIKFNGVPPKILSDFKSLIRSKKNGLESIIKKISLEADLSQLDTHTLDRFGILMQEKEREFNLLIDKYIDQFGRGREILLGKDLERYKIKPPALNPEIVERFETLLKNLEKKSADLDKDGALEKAKYARTLCNELKKAFSLYKKGYSDYTTFKNECTLSFAKALPVLEHHRGLKEILVNLWEAVKTFGVSLYRESQKTEGKHWFFKVPTDSIDLINQIKEPIKGLQDETLGLRFNKLVE